MHDIALVIDVLLLVVLSIQLLMKIYLNFEMALAKSLCPTMCLHVMRLMTNF